MNICYCATHQQMMSQFFHIKRDKTFFTRNSKTLSELAYLSASSDPYLGFKKVSSETNSSKLRSNDLIVESFLVYDKEEKMNKGRVEAFTDAVVAIILTIMVLEFKTPETAKWTGIIHQLPYFLLILSAFFLSGWLGTTITTCLP